MTLLRVCRCGRLIDATQRRCANCDQDKKRRDNPRRMQKPQRWVYRDKRWATTRNIVLARADHACQLCGAPATIADHHPYPLTELLRRGLDPFDYAWCRALCHQCSGHHDGPRSRKTEHTAGNVG